MNLLIYNSWLISILHNVQIALPSNLYFTVTISKKERLFSQRIGTDQQLNKNDYIDKL